jgi:hypothetical protein
MFLNTPNLDEFMKETAILQYSRNFRGNSNGIDPFR